MVSRSLLSMGIVVLALFCMPCHASIEAFKQHVQAEVAAINAQAERRQMKDAVERLNSLNRYIEQSLNFDLEEDLAKARQVTPSFKLDLDSKLRPELTANWWQGKYDQGQRALKLSQEAVNGLASMRVLDKQDLAWSYLKTTYGAVKTVKDVVQSVAQQEYFDAFKNAKEGVDGFLEDYDQIDEAELKSLQTDLFAAEVRRLESRAKKAIRELEPVLSFMKSAADEGDRFDRQMQRLQKLARDVEGGKVPALVFGDSRYTWNYETFKISVGENNRSFETGALDCASFKQRFEAIRQAARQDWNRVTGQIKASQDEEQKPRFLQWHNEAWDDFVSVVPPQFTRLYQQRCQGSDAAQSPARQEATSRPVTSAGAVADLGSEVELPVAVGKKPAGAPAAQTQQRPPAQGVGTAPATSVKAADVSSNKSRTPAPQAGSTDRYWENTIPETARFDWVVDSSSFELRYQQSGRTVGFRVYDDSGLKNIKNEYLMDNLGVMHGATRVFTYDAKSQRVYTADVTFYRNNLRTGPAARFNVAGDVESQSFWVEGAKVSEQEYRLKASKDKSLPPLDAALNKIWRTVPTHPGMPVADLPVDAGQIPWHQFDIPAQAVHYVQATPLSGGLVHITEQYDLPGFRDVIGERNWVREGNSAPRITSEEIYREGRRIYREWDKTSGDLVVFEMGMLQLIEVDGIVSYYRKPVGPYYHKNKGQLYYCHRSFGCAQRDCVCPRTEYEKQWRKNAELPPADFMERGWRDQPAVRPGTHPDPDLAATSPSGSRLPPRAEVWKISQSVEGITAEYFWQHRIVGAVAWSDPAMTQPITKRLYGLGQRSVLGVEWYTSGKTKRVNFSGKLLKGGVSALFDESGKLSEYKLYDKKEPYLDKARQAYQGIVGLPSEDAHLSADLLLDTQRPDIPAAERVPSLIAMLGGKGLDQPAVSRLHPVEPQLPAGEAGEGGDAAAEYQRLQRQELLTLLEQVNAKLNEADKAFDARWWAQNAPAQVTMQATNPKQQSLDILRAAIPLIERARYPENKGGLYQLLAYKSSNYSGRVFAYGAKQDFFSLAVELLLKSDGLIESNRFVKDRLSEAYADSAAVWREMTRKAQWGNHAYNKLYCDRKVIEQYERALRADPNNLQVRKVLEQLKAPKKAIPAAAQALPELAPEKWDVAQTLMAQLDTGGIDALEPPESEAKPLMIAEMTLTLSAGRVDLKLAGTNEWKSITDPVVMLSPRDAVRTAADASDVMVTYASDRAKLALLPDSEVVFQDEQTLMIARAGCHVQVQKRGQEFLIITPTAAVGIRGTRFDVNVAPDKTTRTWLYEGLLETRTAREVVWQEPGQSLTVSRDADQVASERFDPTARLRTEWAGLDRKWQQHEALLETSRASSSAPQLSSSAGYAGAASVAKAKGSASASAKPTVIFSWSPTGTWSAALSEPPFNYGTHNLVARIPVRQIRATPVTVNWYLGKQLISSGEHTLLPEAEWFDGQIVTTGEPIRPGRYRVEFMVQGQRHASGEVEILAPERLEIAAANRQYAAALEVMQKALLKVEQGDLFESGVVASGELVHLRQILWSAPDLPDVQAVMELCLALILHSRKIIPMNH